MNAILAFTMSNALEILPSVLSRVRHTVSPRYNSDMQWKLWSNFTHPNISGYSLMRWNVPQLMEHLELSSISLVVLLEGFAWRKKLRNVRMASRFQCGYVQKSKTKTMKVARWPIRGFLVYSRKLALVCVARYVQTDLWNSLLFYPTVKDTIAPFTIRRARLYQGNGRTYSYQLKVVVSFLVVETQARRMLMRESA